MQKAAINNDLKSEWKLIMLLLKSTYIFYYS